ncbi:bifunctional 3,4-dihydroxy-2-butanone-4-phosphate synthase/GTP cyclohydrolase II [Pseudomonas akapageensis]|uniref:bifunctional 3,4-dihydroxy-2-butanone-4-phosphate synthase/GTP cyclohydrolase II n=1 Tax=Pseudomonas akapageensis TaxID=2609961 RepID=UPI0014097D2F|nr:bifunctional 3,4-dihydroxy-2-butanone-4-phosphate synthase/GTP cyclohydrolase II [Pseudomonas akapageensis]
MPLSSIEDIIRDIRARKMVILIDDEDRENEGDLIIAAECITAAHINFMAKHARGLICMPMSKTLCDQLCLPLMVTGNASGFGTRFTVSIEAKEGISTGISAADRAHTVQVAVSRNAKSSDLVSPGHMFPLMAQPGGVLARAGHTEAACDLARIAGFAECGVICEIMNEDGSMARRPELEAFAEMHGLKIGTIADLIHYRLLHEHTVRRIDEQTLETEQGPFRMFTYRDEIESDVHLALVRGDLASHEVPLVRVHNMDPLRDLLHVQQPGRWSLRAAMARVADEGTGVVLLLGNSLEGEDLVAHLRQPTKASKVLNTYSTVGAGSQILRDLGVRKMRLLSSHVKFNSLSGFELEVMDYISPDI